MLTAATLVLGGCASPDSDVATTDVESTARPETTAEQRETSAVGYDLQGHRGARGLRPENTLPGFEQALDLLVTTLEFDLHYSADGVVVVWHDPLVEPDKCDVVEAMAVRELTASELGEILCDRNPDPGRFPEQSAELGAVAGDVYTVATLSDVFVFVFDYSESTAKTEEQRSNAAMVRFNIETKRKPDDAAAIGDGFDGTSPGPFETAVIETATEAGVIDRIIVQSFDHRSLWAIASEYPEVALAALTRRDDVLDFADLVANGASIWSPDYRAVTPATFEAASEAGLLVIPWTVNDPADMETLLELGVDGIITDRPDLAPPVR